MTGPETPLEDDAREPVSAVGGRRAPRITREQVLTAAWELATEGHRPTIERVRMRLGGGVPRGFPNTVNAWLNEWWSQLAVRLRDRPTAVALDVPERVAAALETLWNEARLGARESLAESLAQREQALTAREQALEADAHRLAEREQQVTSRANALEEALTLMREQLAAANQRAEALETSARRREAEHARTLKHLAAEQRALRAEGDRLQRELARTQARLATLPHLRRPARREP